MRKGRRACNRHSRCRACGKHRFATKEAAEATICRLSAVGRDEKRAYYAHGWWHITSHAEQSHKAETGKILGSHARMPAMSENCGTCGGRGVIINFASTNNNPIVGACPCGAKPKITTFIDLGAAPGGRDDG